jgi:tetratricopeptide (TPR) repeat protein
MRPLTRFAFAALAYALVVPAAANAGFRCPAKGGPQWREYRSKHFVVDTDASPSAVAFLIGQLERMHVLELRALVGEQVEIPGPARVIAFADQHLFVDVAGSADVAAYFKYSKLREPTIVLPVEFADQGVNVAHEMAHYVSRFIFPRQPTWFSEGLAQFVQTVAVTRWGDTEPRTGTHLVRSQIDQGRVGFAPEGMQRSLATVPNARLDDLMKWDGRIDRHAGKHYVHSWLLYHWLWNSRSRQFTAFQQRLSNGEDPAAALRAELPEMDAANPAAVEKVEEELDRYRLNGKYLFYRVTAKSDASFAEGPPLGSADVHMLLLGASGSRDEDREVLGVVDEALREDPAQPEAVVARAKADKSSPLPFLRKSVAARPADWRAWLLFGAALDDGSGEEKEAAYRKAVALNPDSARAHETLAGYLLSRGRAKEALPLANRALDLVPADEDSVDTLAAVAAGLGKCKEALALERRATAMASKDHPRAEEMKKRLAEYEARCGSAAPAAASVVPASSSPH